MEVGGWVSLTVQNPHVYPALFISVLKKPIWGGAFLTETAVFPVFQVQMSVYFLGHAFFFVAFLSVPYLRKMFVPKKERGPLKRD